MAGFFYLSGVGGVSEVGGDSAKNDGGEEEECGRNGSEASDSLVGFQEENHVSCLAFLFRPPLGTLSFVHMKSSGLKLHHGPVIWVLHFHNHRCPSCEFPSPTSTKIVPFFMSWIDFIQDPAEQMCELKTSSNFQVEEQDWKSNKKGNKKQNLMGGNGSSSRRKPSKKKSSKNYSQVSRKKKIRRNESKKHGRRHDSDDHSINSASISTSTSESDYKSRKNKYKKIRRDYSISSDDNSMNSASDSPSNLHNDYRSRKAKSGLQRRRKRARERSTSPDRNKDSHRVRKRKRSKRNHDVKPKKKSLKKSKKQLSVSSSSSDSQSCPTRRSRSSDRTMEMERAKVMLDKEKQRVRGRDAHKVHRKRKVRSPSCSSCSRDSDHSVSQTEEVAAIANSSRRLRSVIAVVEHPHDKEENEWEADPNKEEIVYNHDDFPSPRSIESDDVGCKGESEYHSLGASNKKSRIGEEVTKHSFSGMEGSDKKNNTGDTKSNEVDSNTFEKKTITDVSVSVTDLGGDDLETILRQKALENLRNFRGGLQTHAIANLKIDNESDVNKFSSAGADVIQNKSIKQDSSNVACLTREKDHSSMPTITRDLSHYKEIEKDITGHDNVGKERRTNKQNAIHLSDGAALSIHSENEDCSTAHVVITKPPSIPDPNQGAGATNACSSAIMESTCVEPTSGEHTLKDQQNEAKDSSQFEQKRMSVMRGGEMVEVSYKVYIPKRAPALARRQLRR
ncbi:Uncharacterized protein Adt_37108 [Abeliophyllum distichum]|uniref:Uncharacterized protein n=1 Tax=Abeliophyllum distichum TaxID=126358 RepID=A0ABD1QJG1_9LAMI